MSADDYQKRVDRIEELANNPEALSAHISNGIEGLSEHLPNISQSLATHMSTGIGYLNSKIPRPVNNQIMNQNWKPSEMQKIKFNRHFDAVDKPVGVLKQLKEGRLTKESLESLQAVHPQLYKEMQNQLKSQISPDVAKSLPNHIKRGLSMFLGQPLESQDLPSVKAANQASFAAINQTKNQQPLSGKTTQGGMAKLEISQRAATQTDKAEDMKD